MTARVTTSMTATVPLRVATYAKRPSGENTAFNGPASIKMSDPIWAFVSVSNCIAWPGELLIPVIRP